VGEIRKSLGHAAALHSTLMPAALMVASGHFIATLPNSVVRFHADQSLLGQLICRFGRGRSQLRRLRIGH
jgi:hypothetical protein